MAGMCPGQHIGFRIVGMCAGQNVGFSMKHVSWSQNVALCIADKCRGQKQAFSMTGNMMTKIVLQNVLDMVDYSKLKTVRRRIRRIRIRR